LQHALDVTGWKPQRHAHGFTDPEVRAEHHQHPAGADVVRHRHASLATRLELHWEPESMASVLATLLHIPNVNHSGLP
jgi:hypothetical protein